MPIQPAGVSGVRGTVEVFEEDRAGLEFVPFMDTRPRGLFATRAPKRPNPIGLSVVRLDRVENGVLHVQDVDILDGTPLLAIKPHVPEFDSHSEVRTGWLEQARKSVDERESDDRFS